MKALHAVFYITHMCKTSCRRQIINESMLIRISVILYTMRQIFLGTFTYGMALTQIFVRSVLLSMDHVQASSYSKIMLKRCVRSQYPVIMCVQAPLWRKGVT